MKIERYLKLIAKKWWVIVLLEIVALSLTYYFAAAQPSTYTSRAILILNPNSTNSIIPYTNPDSTTAETLAINYNLVLKSENFLSKVLAQLDFPMTAEQLKQSFTSNLTPETLAYNISATANTPEKAFKITSAVLAVFLEKQTAQNNSNDPGSTSTALQTQLNSLNADIDQLNKDITALNGQPDSTDKQTQLAAKKDDLSNKLNLKAQTVLAIADLDGKGTTNNKNYATLLNTPKLPVQPDASNLLRNLIFAFALALALGIGVILLLYYMDNTVRSTDDLFELTGKTPLASIPEIETAESRAKAAAKDKAGAKNGVTVADAHTKNLVLSRSPKLNELLVTSEATYSPAAEAYRALRTRMLFSGPGQPGGLDSVTPTARTFLVTSSLPAEGRSLTAANLAIAFAQTGKKVILIDSDLRHPSVHTLFNLSNKIGFSDLALYGITKLTKAVHSTAIPNLVVVTSGSVLENPSELLTSTKAANVIKFFKNIADIVIFDAPPVNLVTDAAILAKMVDQVMLVVEDRVTPRNMLVNTIQELDKVGAELDGIILNRVKDTKSRQFRNYFSSIGTNSGRTAYARMVNDKSISRAAYARNGKGNDNSNGNNNGSLKSKPIEIFPRADDGGDILDEPVVKEAVERTNSNGHSNGRSNSKSNNNKVL